MRRPLDELRQGNTSIFETLNDNDTIFTLELIKKETDRVNIFINLINKIYSVDLINIIYDIPELESELLKLLTNCQELKSIKNDVFNYIVDNTSWGFDLIINHFNELYKKLNLNPIINIIRKDPSKLKALKQALIDLNSKSCFGIITRLLERQIYFEKEYISFLLNNFPNNDFAFYLLTYLYNSDNSFVMYCVYKENIKEIFKTSNSKIAMLSRTPELFSKETVKKYNYFNTMYRLAPSSYKNTLDFVLSSLIDQNLDEELLCDIKTNMINNELWLLGSGATSVVFKIGNKVLKISQERFTWEVPNDFFGIIPTKRRIIKNNSKNIGLIEWQDLIITEDTRITEENIYQLFLEFQKVGLKICDPLCLSFKPDNFGILNSYQDANTTNPEELPEWFKKTPLVLLDVDTIIPRDEKNISIFQRYDIFGTCDMDEAIRLYKKRT